MAYSMTGFGRSEYSSDEYKLTVEIRSVNHRYLDLNIRLGHRLSVFENKIRGIIRDGITRGKVDASFILHLNAGFGEDIVYNSQLAKMYADSIARISDEFGLGNDLSATKLAGMKDVLSLSEADVDENALWDQVQKTLTEAIKDLNDHRHAEGERLKKDILLKLDRMGEIAKHIELRSPELVEEYKAKLTRRINDMFGESGVDTGRIAMEVVIYADKIAIDEEIVRLNSHIASFKDTLVSDDDVGRRLDFIAQEMNRESNTILSKTTDPEISDMGIELKTLIEKIREQIQNLA